MIQALFETLAFIKGKLCSDISKLFLPRVRGSIDFILILKRIFIFYLMFSEIIIVVDDVDDRATEGECHALHKLLTDTTLDLKEESDAKIKQIQVEAESRKMEFARLIEEHALVIKKLKQMEKDGASQGAMHA